MSVCGGGGRRGKGRGEIQEERLVWASVFMSTAPYVRQRTKRFTCSISVHQHTTTTDRGIVI